MSAAANKKVVILYNQLAADAPKDEQDVLVQVEVVSRALAQLGYQPGELGFSLSIKETIKALKEIKPVFVFNLTESVEGDGRLIYLAASLLDHLAVPYTGCSTEALFLTSNKLLTKKMLSLAGIDTPPWVSLDHFQPGITLPPGNYIIKSVWEHASNWFTADSIISFDSEPEPGTLKEILKNKNNRQVKSFLSNSISMGGSLIFLSWLERCWQSLKSNSWITRWINSKWWIIGQNGKRNPLNFAIRPGVLIFPQRMTSSWTG